jgi:pantothenate kinase
MGFDFAVEYRAGKHNTVVEALSRCLEDQLSLTSISMPLLPLFNLIRMEIQNSEQL